MTSRLTIVVFLIILVCCNSPEIKYDKKTKQKEVLNVKELNTTLATFKKINFKDLPKAYVQYTNLNNYPGIYKHKTWYEISPEDQYKYLVGNIRVKDFLPEDKYYKQGQHNYLLIDKRVLNKFLNLQSVLRRNGHDPYAFKVYNGFRHPQNNDKRGGAPRSRHLHGEAIDIEVLDVNKDGKSNQQDKSIVLNLLEKKILENQGGIGRYVGTMKIHFDVRRGKPGRWNSYNRKNGSK